MTVKFTRNSRGVASVLHSREVAATIHDLAVKVAAHVRSQQPDADVVVDDYRTDRAASSVTVRDKKAKLWQAEDGIFTRAAGSVGLEVRQR